MSSRATSITSTPRSRARSSASPRTRRARDCRRSEVSLGRYALCALLDDIVLNTPWGPRSRWPSQRLAAVFHQDVDAGRGFFRELEQAERAPERHRDLLELMYACLAMGFEGVYRVNPPAGRTLQQIKEDLYPPARSLPQPGRPLALAELAGSGRRAGPRAARRAGLDRRGRRPGAARAPLCRVQLSPVRLWRRRGLTTCPRPRRSASHGWNCGRAGAAATACAAGRARNREPGGLFGGRAARRAGRGVRPRPRRRGAVAR